MTTQDFNKVCLGRLKKDAGTCADGEHVYLTKHKWDCGWYWGFGYLGNYRCHFHVDSLLYVNGDKGAYCASDLFEETKITDKEWWVIRDLFVQAYALKAAAEVYQYGGHQTTSVGLTDVIKNKDRADQINADLAKVLDCLWSVVCAAVNKA